MLLANEQCVLYIFLISYNTVPINGINFVPASNEDFKQNENKLFLQLRLRIL